VPLSAIGSVLESVLGSVPESVLGAYSQAGWECAIECNQECTSERAMKCIWQLDFKFVVCSVMYSIQRTNFYHLRIHADHKFCILNGYSLLA